MQRIHCECSHCCNLVIITIPDNFDESIGCPICQTPQSAQHWFEMGKVSKVWYDTYVSLNCTYIPHQ